MLACLAAACGGGETVEPTAGSDALTPEVGQEPAAETAGDPQQGGVLTWGEDRQPDTLHPYRWGLEAIGRILSAMYEPLVTFDPEEPDEFLPALADSWEISDDGMTVTVHLRDGVQFHNGQPLTAEDVAWSVEQQQQAGTSTSALVESIAEVEVLDDLTAELRLGQPDNQIMHGLALMLISPNDPDIDYEDGGIGTGPFKFVSWERNREIVFERNENYWKEGLPHLDGVTFRQFADGSVSVVQLLNEEIDMVNNVSFAEFERVSDAGYEVRALRRPAFYSLIVNAETDGPFGDPLVRRALSHAIDREASAAVLLDTVESAWSPIPPDHPNLNEEAIDYSTRDVERAREVLAEAGYPDGVDAGTLLVCNAGLDYTTQANVMQQSAAEAGINMTMETVDLGTWLQRVFTDRDFSITYCGHVPQGYSAYGLLSGTYAGTYEPAVGWESERPAFFELIREARSLTDPDEYQAALDELQVIAMEDQPYILSTTLKTFYAAQDYVHGLEDGPHGRFLFENVWLEQ
jgi:peptide/nickel transport system substrate-binding protein